MQNIAIIHQIKLFVFFFSIRNLVSHYLASILFEGLRKIHRSAIIVEDELGIIFDSSEFMQGQWSDVQSQIAGFSPILKGKMGKVFGRVQCHILNSIPRPQSPHTESRNNKEIALIGWVIETPFGDP